MLSQVTKDIRATNILESIRQVFHKSGSSHERTRISLQGKLTPAPSKKISDSEERTLTAQSTPNSETDSSFTNLPYDSLERKISSDPK